jgi:crossover junction endodeoxyribonuclease RusA
MVPLQFVVYGVPQVQGNHRAGRAGRFAKIYDANPELPYWRDKVSYAARAQAKLLKHPMEVGPVKLDVTFWLARPRSAPKTRDVRPTTRGGGDWDKLARAIGDSLVDAGVIADDSQIVDAHVQKYYAVTRDLTKIYMPGFHMEQPGADILLTNISTTVEPMSAVSA